MVTFPGIDTGQSLSVQQRRRQESMPVPAALCDRTWRRRHDSVNRKSNRMEAATFGAEWIVRRIGVSGDGGGLLVGESAASECHADVGG